VRDLNLVKYNVRDATIRSLLALCNEFGIKAPTPEQQITIQEISDQLENRVQDEIDAQAKVDAIQVEEETFVTVEDSEIFLELGEDGEPRHITHKGVVFGKLCNEPVHYDHETGQTSFCIKQWNHLNAEHEDSVGRFRL